MSSVKEIVNECEKMFLTCNGIEERVDIYYAEKKLRESLRELVEEYEKYEYDEAEVMIKKGLCCRDAIYLEYIISGFDVKLRQRYVHRVKVTKLFEKIDAIMRVEVANGHAGKGLLGQMLCNYAQAGALMRKVQDIIFSLTMDELELLELIESQVGQCRDQRI